MSTQLARFERERIAEQQEAAESLRLRFQADEMVKAEELAKKKEKLRKLTKISSELSFFGELF